MSTDHTFLTPYKFQTLLEKGRVLLEHRTYINLWNLTTLTIKSYHIVCWFEAHVLLQLPKNIYYYQHYMACILCMVLCLVIFSTFNISTPLFKTFILMSLCILFQQQKAHKIVPSCQIEMRSELEQCLREVSLPWKINLVFRNSWRFIVSKFTLRIQRAEISSLRWFHPKNHRSTECSLLDWFDLININYPHVVWVGLAEKRNHLHFSVLQEKKNNMYHTSLKH